MGFALSRTEKRGWKNPIGSLVSIERKKKGEAKENRLPQAAWGTRGEHREKKQKKKNRGGEKWGGKTAGGGEVLGR